MPTRESRIRRQLRMTGQHVGGQHDKMKVSKDAVDILLRAFGYPTTAPTVPPESISKLHKENE
jgi:hypothetical protein